MGYFLGPQFRCEKVIDSYWGKMSYKHMTNLFIILLFLLYRMVIVNDFELAKQMANTENFSYRPANYLQKHMRGNGRAIGVISTSGDIWRRNRRFSLTTLKGMKLTSHLNLLLMLVNGAIM